MVFGSPELGVAPLLYPVPRNDRGQRHGSSGLFCGSRGRNAPRSRSRCAGNFSHRPLQRPLSLMNDGHAARSARSGARAAAWRTGTGRSSRAPGRAAWIRLALCTSTAAPQQGDGYRRSCGHCAGCCGTGRERCRLDPLLLRRRPPVAITPAPHRHPRQQIPPRQPRVCTAIAPLMTEDNRVAKTLSSLGARGRRWNAAMPKFVSDTKDWVGRIQPVIDSHPDAEPYFRRSLQRSSTISVIWSLTSRRDRGSPTTRPSGTTAWALKRSVERLGFSGSGGSHGRAGGHADPAILVCNRGWLLATHRSAELSQRGRGAA